MHVTERETPRGQTHRVDFHFDTFGESAPRIHLRHAGHGAQARTDHVIVQCLEIGERHRIAGHHVLIQLAHGRRDRTESRFDARRQCTFCIAQTLLHELSREVHVDIVGERHGDERQAELRHRAHALRARCSHERRLDGMSHEAFDLFRRHAGSGRDHLDPRARQIGKGIEWDVLQRVQSRRHDGQRERHHDATPPQHEMNEGTHAYSPAPPRRRSNSAFAMAAPRTTTVVPLATPATSSTRSALRRPTRTGVARRNTSAP